MTFGIGATDIAENDQIRVTPVDECLQQAEELYFCRFLNGHEVQNQYMKGTDILGPGPFFSNGYDSFLLQF